MMWWPVICECTLRAIAFLCFYPGRATMPVPGIPRSIPCWIHGSRHTNLAHGGIPMTGECDAIRLTRDTHAYTYSMPIGLSLLSVQASTPSIPYKSWVSWSAPTSPRPVVSSHSQITYHEPTTHMLGCLETLPYGLVFVSSPIPEPAVSPSFRGRITSKPCVYVTRASAGLRPSHVHVHVHIHIHIYLTTGAV